MARLGCVLGEFASFHRPWYFINVHRIYSPAQSVAAGADRRIYCDSALVGPRKRAKGGGAHASTHVSCAISNISTQLTDIPRTDCFGSSGDRVHNLCISSMAHPL